MGAPALLLLLLGTAAFPVTVLGQVPVSPTKLWEFNPAGAATVNDVALDATGQLAAAVYSDAGLTNLGDDEVYIWDLGRDETSSNPVLQDDPRAALTAPEGLGVVAIAPTPTAKADYVVVGREGSPGQSSEHKIYGYQVSRGVGERKEATAPTDLSSTSAVNHMWLSDDAARLLSWQAAQLTLYKKESGAKYTAIDEWVPPTAEQSILAVAVAPDLKAIAVSTTVASAVNDDVHRIHLLDVDTSLADDKEIEVLASATERSTEDENGAFVAVDVSDDGEYVVAGSQDRIVWYYQIVPDRPNSATVHDADSFEDFSTPWSDQVSGAVTSVGMSSDGLTFAAGFESQGLWVYRFTSRDPEDQGPLAQRAIRSAVATHGPPRRIEFTNQDNTLFAVSDVLHSFSSIQFDPRDELVPLWQVPGGESFAVSRDGNRFVVGSAEKVIAYEQKYAATVTFPPPPAATPGETLSLTMNVANTGSAFDEYQLSTTSVPASWVVEIEPDRLNMLPGETAEVTFNATPPAGEPPGQVDISLHVGSRFNPGADEAAVEEIPITVSEVHGADVEVDVSTLEVTRGQKARLDVEVFNTGNVRDTILVEVSQRTAWPVTISGSVGSTKTFDIGGGASTTAVVEFDVPSGASQGSSNLVTLRARPQSGGTQAQETVTLVIEPDYGATVSGPTGPVSGDLDEDVEFDVTLHNTGNTRDTFALRAYSNATNPAHLWEARLSHTSVEVGPDGTRTITVTVHVPRGAEDAEAADVTVIARSAASGQKEGEGKFRVQVSEGSDDSPFPLLLVPLALGAAALARRRRA